MLCNTLNTLNMEGTRQQREHSERHSRSTLKTHHRHTLKFPFVSLSLRWTTRSLHSGGSWILCRRVRLSFKAKSKPLDNLLDTLYITQYVNNKKKKHNFNSVKHRKRNGETRFQSEFTTSQTKMWFEEFPMFDFQTEKAIYERKDTSKFLLDVICLNAEPARDAEHQSNVKMQPGCCTKEC